MQQLAPTFTLSRDVDSPLIIVDFQLSWSQEDVDKLAEYLFQTLKEHRIIEHAYGADLETFHFTYQQHEYLLNFEFYSQSCWVEALNNQSVENISNIFKSFIAKN